MATEKQTPGIRRIVALLWSSFLTAGVATVLFFAAFDPQAILMETRFADLSRLGAYTAGFFLFWTLTASSCALMDYFQRPFGQPGPKP